MGSGDIPGATEVGAGSVAYTSTPGRVGPDLPQFLVVGVVVCDPRDLASPRGTSTPKCGMDRRRVARFKPNGARAGAARNARERSPLISRTCLGAISLAISQYVAAKSADFLLIGVRTRRRSASWSGCRND